MPNLLCIARVVAIATLLLLIRAQMAGMHTHSFPYAYMPASWQNYAVTLSQRTPLGCN